MEVLGGSQIKTLKPRKLQHIHRATGLLRGEELDSQSAVVLTPPNSITQFSGGEACGSAGTRGLNGGHLGQGGTHGKLYLHPL